jgi:hypothetical protein
LIFADEKKEGKKYGEFLKELLGISFFNEIIPNTCESFCRCDQKS